MPVAPLDLDELEELIKTLSKPLDLPPRPPSTRSRQNSTDRPLPSARRVSIGNGASGKPSVLLPPPPPSPRTQHFAPVVPPGGSTPRRTKDEQHWLDAFIVRHSESYSFSGEQLERLFDLLFNNRFVYCDEYEVIGGDYILRIVLCLRLLMRDNHRQNDFVGRGGLRILGTIYNDLALKLFSDHGDAATHISDTLVAISSIVKRLASDPDHRSLLLKHRMHHALVLLLNSTEMNVLQCVLIALGHLASSAGDRKAFADLDCIETLLRVMHDYEDPLKILAADVLYCLSEEEDRRTEIKLHGGSSVLLSLVTTSNIELKQYVIRIIKNMSKKPECATEIRLLGGIPLILSLINTKGNAIKNSDSSLLIAVCSTLKELSAEYENANQIRESNGVYFLGKLLLEGLWNREDNGDDKELLRAHVFRTMRYLFSVERNRSIFKRLFPPGLFDTFIDVGHYVNDINQYLKLGDMLASLPSKQLSMIDSALEDINVLEGEDQRHIGDYVVLEVLGKGAFGTVYKVRDSHKQLYALKELSLDDMAEVPDDEHGDRTEIETEVSILEKLEHPNIVRYHRSFKEHNNMYIVMELVEGSSLTDYINTIAEKGQTIPEEKIWQIFTQLVLAMQYIHKEKCIVHRDLTPSNILLNPQNRVKIVDFGLARQRHSSCSVMKSVVGTILYSCPEIIQHESYDEKADVWSLGCILYQMAALKPPFAGSNLLAVARKIVESEVEPLPTSYSPLLRNVVRSMLTPSRHERPDITGVSSQIAGLLLREIDRLHRAHADLRRDIQREREEKERHIQEAQHHQMLYHRFCQQQKVRRQTSAGVTPLGAHNGSAKDFGMKSPLKSTRQKSGSLSSPMLSISPHKLRPISDPSSQMLNQLYKIIYITQLPPSLDRNPKRKCVDIFKRNLFSLKERIHKDFIKNELKKLMTASSECVELDFGHIPAELGIGKENGDVMTSTTSIPASHRLTYDDIQHIIEDVLTETGYYEYNPAPSPLTPGLVNDLEVTSPITPTNGAPMLKIPPKLSL